MSAFTNSEQLYGVLTAVQSGNGTTYVNGPGILVSVITSITSGTIATPASLSGASFLAYNGVSGSATVNTGKGVLYAFYGGTASGVGTAGLPVLPPDFWGPQPFQSGLCLQVNASPTLQLTASYRQGI